MEPKSWCEISGQPLRERLDMLSRALSQMGVENSLEIVVASKESEFEHLLGVAQQKYDQIRIGSPFGDRTMSFFPRATQTALRLGACDALVRKDG